MPLLIAFHFIFYQNPVINDRVFLAALFFSVFVCRYDKDVVSAILIVIGYFVFAELVYWLPTNSIVTAAIYAISAVVSVSIIKYLSAKINLVFILIGLFAELYWFLTDYAAHPDLYYYLFNMTAICFARFLLLTRYYWMYDKFDHLSGKVALDWQIRWVLNVYFMLNIAIFVEYLLRHLLGYYHIKFVYNIYSQTAYLLSFAVLAAIYMNFFHTKMQRHMKC